MTNPQKFKPRPVAKDRVKKRGLLWGLVTAGDPSPKPGQRSGVNGPGPPRPAGGMEPEGAPLVGAWRSQAATVNGPKSVVQTRTWPRGNASAGRWRSRRPACPAAGLARDPRRHGGRRVAPILVPILVPVLAPSPNGDKTGGKSAGRRAGRCGEKGRANTRLAQTPCRTHSGRRFRRKNVAESRGGTGTCPGEHRRAGRPNDQEGSTGKTVVREGEGPMTCPLERSRSGRGVSPHGSGDTGDAPGGLGHTP